MQIAGSPFITNKHYVETALARASLQDGANVILYGGGGEAGLTYHGKGVYADLFVNGRWPTLFRELKALRQFTNVPEWLNFRSRVLRPLLPTSFWQTLRPAPFTAQTQRERAHFLQPHFLERHFGKSYKKQLQKLSPVGREYANHRKNQALLIRDFQSPSLYYGFVDEDKVEFRFPLLNKKLLEFCLAAPAHLKIKDGYRRYLGRGALDGILPPKIQWRTTKEPFSPAYYQHYNAQRQIAVSLFSSIKKNDPLHEIIDVEKLKQWSSYDMTETRDSDIRNYVAAYLVPQAVYLITFLRQFDDFRL